MATSKSLGCFHVRQAPHNVMQNIYKSLPLVQRKRYRHVVGSSHLWNALLSPDGDLELFFPLEEGGNSCYLYKCMFWKAAIGTETLGRSKDCCSCMRAVHSTDRHTLQTDTVRRGNSYPKNTDSEEGSINGFQQASTPATAPIQTKFVLS